MKTCQWLMDDKTECGKPAEGGGHWCASHSRALRKFEENQLKQEEKLAAKLLKSKPKRVPVKKVSIKRKIENGLYKIAREEYLILHPKCEAKIQGSCDGNAIEIHHQAGRSGDMLINVKYFLAVCRGCHDYIHQHPLDALKRGLSFSRLAKTETI